MDSGKSEPESILCWFPNLGSYSLGTLTLKIPFSARTGHVGSPATFLGTQTDFFRGSPKKGVVSKRGYRNYQRLWPFELGKRLPATIERCCFNPITSHCNHIAIITHCFNMRMCFHLDEFTCLTRKSPWNPHEISRSGTSWGLVSPWLGLPPQPDSQREVPIASRRFQTHLQKWINMVDFMGFNHQEWPKWGVQLVNSALDMTSLGLRPGTFQRFSSKGICVFRTTLPWQQENLPNPFKSPCSTHLDIKYSFKCKPKNHPIFTNHSPFFGTQQKSVAYLSIIFHICCNWLPPFLGSNPFL